MKAIIFVILSILFSLLSPPSLTAGAETKEQYAVATTDSVYLYQEKTEDSGLFLIPHTYYVKILSVEEDYCKVEYHTEREDYQAVVGYCKTDELLFVNFIPERPYLVYELSVTYSLPTQGSFPSVDGAFSTVTVNYLFYGEFPIGSAKYYYVYGNGAFGYLPATQAVDYEKNTDYLTALPSPPSTAPDVEAGESSASTVFVLVALALSAAVIALLALRGKRSPSTLKEELDF